MSALLRRLIALGFFMGVMAAPSFAAMAEADSSQRLSFDVVEGLNINSFLREGLVAAHLVLRSGVDPRIVVAFPAGNSGIGLWFTRGTQSVTWKLIGRPQPDNGKDGQGRPLYGIRAEVTATGAQALAFKKAALSSVRVLRNYQADGTFPEAVAALPMLEGSTITWARDRLDGAAGYSLRIEVTQGSLQADGITAAKGDVIGLKITALCGEKPMVPLSGERLLNSKAQDDVAARRVLTFLSYREAFLAGSWRFDTYFGRDTLMSVKLLMPTLTPEAVDAGLGAVLTRLSPQGEVAHEENIGEFAVLDHLASGSKSDVPTFDYKMIDASFMLAPVAGAWLLDDARGRLQAREFLARGDNRYGEAPQTMGADLVCNLKFVLHAVAAFADDPRATNLIALKSGVDVGQWRDSNDGLAGGRFAYDVNAVFVPAALTSAGRLFAAGLLDAYLHGDERTQFARAMKMAEVWRTKAAPLFAVTVPNAAARRDIGAYAAELKVPDGKPFAHSGSNISALPCARAPGRWHAHSGAAFRRRFRVLVRAAECGSTRASCDSADAAIPRGTLDTSGRGGGQSGVCDARSARENVPHRLSRHRSLVLATGGAGSRNLAAAQPAGSASLCEKSPARRPGATVERHTRRTRRSQFRTLVMEFRKRSISNRTLRHQRRRRG